MRLTVQKRLAAEILDCSPKKVWADPERLEEIKEAITKQDLRDLIKRGLIIKKSLPQHSRGRARLNKIQRKKGRSKGLGHRKGKFTARNPKKKLWMANVRTQRALLKELREKGIIERKACAQLLRKVKGGFFRSRRHIKLYLSEHRLLKLKAKAKETKTVKPKPKKIEKIEKPGKPEKPETKKTTKKPVKKTEKTEK
jgi:large subunit ribosomal protein L19e